MRRALDLNHDFGGPPVKAFPGTQVEGDARPAPIVDQDLSGDEGLRARGGADTRFGAVSRGCFAVDRTSSVLAAHDRLRDHDEVERADGLQDLELFVADRGGVE